MIEASRQSLMLRSMGAEHPTPITPLTRLPPMPVPVPARSHDHPLPPPTPLTPRPTAPPVHATYVHPYQVDSTSPAIGRPHISVRTDGACNPGMDLAGRERPSAYMRSRCPACFGGIIPLEMSEDGIPHLFVAIDGNFGQKRAKTRSRETKAPKPDPDTSADEGDTDHRKQAGNRGACPPPPPLMFDPRLPMNSTGRLPFEKIAYFQDKAKNLRAKQTAATADAATASLPDVIEKGMKVPNSVLDGCEQSFTAADEHREKASARFFDCMGLAAMVCKHDIPLFWANIYTAGEGHFYAYAMIAELMLHIPPSWLVGVLYDIGCTVHRSVVKWNILGEYLNRLVFAISVFHAFGHQWACQIHYHPRKQRIWGLTDGEGTERLWFLLSHLISILRSVGYFVRLWTLDSQFNEIGKKFVHRLGDWLESRVRKTEIRLVSAEGKLARVFTKLARKHVRPEGMSWETCITPSI